MPSDVSTRLQSITQSAEREVRFAFIHSTLDGLPLPEQQVSPLEREPLEDVVSTVTTHALPRESLWNSSQTLRSKTFHVRDSGVDVLLSFPLSCTAITRSAFAAVVSARFVASRLNMVLQDTHTTEGLATLWTDIVQLEMLGVHKPLQCVRLRGPDSAAFKAAHLPPGLIMGVDVEATFQCRPKGAEREVLFSVVRSALDRLPIKRQVLPLERKPLEDIVGTILRVLGGAHG